MLIDSSAIIAIVQSESDAKLCSGAVSNDPIKLLSAPTMLEISMLLVNRSEVAYEEFLRLAKNVNIEIVPVDEEQSNIAIDVFRRYGKVRHPARLNYGDCLSCALAKQMDEPLFFKGDDFSQTDVKVAV